MLEARLYLSPLNSKKLENCHNVNVVNVVGAFKNKNLGKLNLIRLYLKIKLYNYYKMEIENRYQKYKDTIKSYQQRHREEYLKYQREYQRKLYQKKKEIKEKEFVKNYLEKHLN